MKKAGKIFSLLFLIGTVFGTGVKGVGATTTVGTDITTDGNVTVDGNATLGDASADLISITGTVQGTSPFVFEGTTADDFEMTFTLTNPTADRTITFQDGSGTVAFLTDIPDDTDTDDQSLFETMNAPSGSDPVADSATDTLNFAGSANLTITGDSVTDTLTFDIADSYLLNTGDVATGNYDFAAATILGASPFVFEGAVANGFQTSFALTEPTADRTITFQDADGTIAFLTDIPPDTDTDDQSLFETFDTPAGSDPVADSATDTIAFTAGSANITITGDSGTDTVTFDIADSYLLNSGDTAIGTYDFTTATLLGGSPLVLEGASANDFETSVALVDPTADRTITFQDGSGTVAFLTDIPADTDTDDQSLFETMNAPSGSDPVAESATDTLNFAGSANLTITGDSITDTLTFDVADSYLFNTGDVATGTYDFSGAVLSSGSPFTFEGATSNDFETTFSLADPTADNTVTFQDASGTVAFLSDIPADTDTDDQSLFETINAPAGSDPVADSATDTLNVAVGSANITIVGDNTTDTLTFDIADSYLLNNGDTATGDYDFTSATLLGGSPLVFEGATANGFETAFSITNPTADNTITFQNGDGTVAFLSDIPAGVDQNLFETFNAPAGTDPVADSTTDTLNFAAGSANITVTGDSTTDTVTFDIADSYLLNTGDTATGNFNFSGAILTDGSPFTFEGATANDFETTFAFTDPTADRIITFPNASLTVNAAGDLSGTTLASNVVTSSLTSVGTLSSLTVSGATSTGSLTIGSGNSITKFISTTVVINFASIVVTGCNAQTAAVTGAALGDTVVIAPTTNDATLDSGVLSARVSSAGNITAVFCAVSTVDVPSLTYRVDVWQH